MYKFTVFTLRNISFELFDFYLQPAQAVLVNVNVNWEFIEMWLKDREGQINAAQKKNKDNLFADIEVGVVCKRKRKIFKIRLFKLFLMKHWF